jgi:hypothetical protein
MISAQISFAETNEAGNGIDELLLTTMQSRASLMSQVSKYSRIERAHIIKGDGPACYGQVRATGGLIKDLGARIGEMSPTQLSMFMDLVQWGSETRFYCKYNFGAGMKLTPLESPL